MNFIDDALKNKDSGEGFVQAMADIYEHSDIRDELVNYPKWIRNIITIIDYDTDLQMERLDFKSYDNEITALKDVGLMEEAEALLLLNSGSTDEDIESVYSKLAINNNYDVALVKELLQHSSIATTQRYLTMSSAKVEEALNKHVQLL